jgi:outer membrane protein TolC
MHAYQPRYLAAAAVFLTLLTSRPAASAETLPEPEPISLDNALRRAVEGNVDLQRARVAIQTSGAAVVVARGAFDVLLTGSGKLSRSASPKLGPDDATGGVTTGSSFKVGLARLLETGGHLSLGYERSSSKLDPGMGCGITAEGIDPCRVHTDAATVSLVQPLLQGLGPWVAEADIRRRVIDRDVAFLNRQAQAAVVVRDIVNAYWQLSFAHEVVAIQQGTLASAQEQLRSTNSQVSVGRLARVDSAAAEQAVSGTLLQIIGAEEDVLTKTLALRQLLGLDSLLPVRLMVATDRAEPVIGAIDEQQKIQLAMENNAALRALRMGRQLSDVDLAVARSQLLPKLDLDVSVSAEGKNHGANEAFRQTRELDNKGWSVGLTFALPLPNRAARGALEAARLGREKVDLDVGALQRDIRNQVIHLVSTIRNGSRRIQLARDTVGFAELNLKAERARFALGRSTNNDVLRVQQDLQNAKLQGVSAGLDVLFNLASLEALTGEILDHYRINLR